MITPDELVRREVHYCVSSLVSTLAQNCAAVTCGGDADRSLCNLAEQAQELAFPVPDYEEAAQEAGWTAEAGGSWRRITKCAGAIGQDLLDRVESAESACSMDDIEPYYREVFEHWIVSNWLADKLAEKGEKVDKDFAGMVVWARTTTGQAISIDWVIEQITADLNAPEVSTDD